MKEIYVHVQFLVSPSITVKYAVLEGKELLVSGVPLPLKECLQGDITRACIQYTLTGLNESPAETNELEWESHLLRPIMHLFHTLRQQY